MGKSFSYIISTAKDYLGIKKEELEFHIAYKLRPLYYQAKLDDRL